MHSGHVQLLLILAGDPVYNSHADIDFAGALQKVPLSIHLGLHNDETSRLTHWHLPESHSYEAWSDARAVDGTITILQPLILPLYDSRTQMEVLDLFLHTPNRDSRELVRTYWEERLQPPQGSQAGKPRSILAQPIPPQFEDWLRKSVGEGLIAGSALPEIAPPLQANAGAPPPQAPLQPGLELVFRPDLFLYDGRYANNAWLQELPRNITKLTWDNAVHVSPRTAGRLHLVEQELVEIQFDGRRVRGPI